VVQILLVIPFFLQGGVLRACQWQELLGVGSGGTAACVSGVGTPVTAAAIEALGAAEEERSHEAGPCFCDYGKGLGHSERPVASGEPHHAALPEVRPTVVAASNVASRGTPVRAPEPPDARRSLPLLI
jgi:hypothetical protein